MGLYLYKQCTPVLVVFLCCLVWFTRDARDLNCPIRRTRTGNECFCSFCKWFCQTSAVGVIQGALTKAISHLREIEARGTSHRKRVAETLLVSSYEDCVKAIQQAFDVGFDHVYVVSSSQHEQPKTVATLSKFGKCATIRDK